MVEALTYIAPWYYRGDPDDLFVGLLYGIIAIVTIFCVECIAEKVLFFGSKGIVSSDIAARISFSNSTWFDVARWLFQRSNKPFCKRAILGLIFRLFVLLLDIFIILLSLSCSVEVTEKETGITGLSFGKTQRAHIATPCLRDNIEYEGFTSKAVREVCLTTTWIPQHAMDSVYGLPQSLQRSDKDIVIIAIHQAFDMLYVADVRSKTLHTIALVMRISGNKNKRTIAFHTRNAAVEEAVEMLLRFNCTRVAMPSIKIGNELKIARALNCRGRRPRPNLLSLKTGFDSTPRPHELLFSHASTHKEKLPLVFERQTSDNITITGPQKIGTINRPRLCILPSLLALAPVLVLGLILNVRKDSEDVIFKLWVYVTQKGDMENGRNPLDSGANELKTDWSSSSYPLSSLPDT